MLLRIGTKMLVALFALAAVCTQCMAQMRLETPRTVTSEGRAMLQRWFDRIEIIEDFKSGKKTFRLIDPVKFKISDAVEKTLAYWALDVDVLRNNVTIWCLMVMVFPETRKEKFVEVYDQFGVKVDFSAQTPHVIEHRPIIRGNVVYQPLMIEIHRPVDLFHSGIKYQAYSSTGTQPIVTIPGEAIEAVVQKALMSIK